MTQIEPNFATGPCPQNCTHQISIFGHLLEAGLDPNPDLVEAVGDGGNEIAQNAGV